MFVYECNRERRAPMVGKVHAPIIEQMGDKSRVSDMNINAIAGENGIEG